MKKREICLFLGYLCCLQTLFAQVVETEIIYTQEGGIGSYTFMEHEEFLSQGYQFQQGGYEQILNLDGQDREVRIENNGSDWILFLDGAEEARATSLSQTLEAFSVDSSSLSSAAIDQVLDTAQVTLVGEKTLAFRRNDGAFLESDLNQYFVAQSSLNVNLLGFDSQGFYHAPDTGERTSFALEVNTDFIVAASQQYADEELTILYSGVASAFAADSVGYSSEDGWSIAAGGGRFKGREAQALGVSYSSGEFGFRVASSGAVKAI